MDKFLLIFLTLACTDLTNGAEPTGVVTFYNGSESTIQHPVAEIDLTQTVTDVCVIGTFMTYDSHNFEIQAYAMTFWNYPPNDSDLFCWGGMNYTVGSARPLAHGVDTNASFASLYAAYFNQYDELIITDSLPDITIPIGSILTRKTDLELFSKPNFEGERFCIKDCGYLICDHAFTEEIPEQPWNIAQAKSAKLGCSNTKNSVKSKPLGNSEGYSGMRKMKK